MAAELKNLPELFSQLTLNARIDTRQLLVNASANEFEQLPERLKELKPAERIDAICKLSKFALPAVAPVSIVKIERKENPSNDMFAVDLN